MSNHREVEQPKVEYLGRLVNRNGFRVMIYHHDGSEKVAEGYAEYLKIISKGEWYTTKEQALTHAQKLADKKAPEEVSEVKPTKAGK